MLCEVTILMRDGMRLKKQELAKPILTFLEVRNWKLHVPDMRRHVRVANLYVNAGKAKGITGSIFDPEVVTTTADGFVFRGYEVVLTDNGKREVVQMWLCRPTRGNELPLPAFNGSVSGFAQL